jgi:hypothetical protein
MMTIHKWSAVQSAARNATIEPSAARTQNVFSLYKKNPSGTARERNKELQPKVVSWGKEKKKDLKRKDAGK